MTLFESCPYVFSCTNSWASSRFSNGPHYHLPTLYLSLRSGTNSVALLCAFLAGQYKLSDANSRCSPRTYVVHVRSHQCSGQCAWSVQSSRVATAWSKWRGLTGLICEHKEVPTKILSSWYRPTRPWFDRPYFGLRTIPTEMRMARLAIGVIKPAGTSEKCEDIRSKWIR